MDASARDLDSSDASHISCICLCPAAAALRLTTPVFRGGGGIIFAHAYAITVNDSAKLAGDLILFKGCTIGGVRGGPRGGVPVIGHHVVIGLNATVVGGITVGDDVFIAPNAFVNFDVPSHLLVIGNPGIIHHKERATKGYFVDV